MGESGTLSAVHDYGTDKIMIHGVGGTVVLHNQWCLALNQMQAQPEAPVCIIMDKQPPAEDEELAEVDVDALSSNTSLFTRATNPHKEERPLTHYYWEQYQP